MSSQHPERETFTPAQAFDYWIDKYQSGEITYKEAIDHYVGEILTNREAKQNGDR